jgi:hypothetical protein
MSWAIARNWVKYTLMTLPVKIAAFLVVPFLNEDQRIRHPVFGARDATDLSYYNIAVRNGGHNYLVLPLPEYDQWPADLADETLEKESGFQWRARRSKTDPAYASIRFSWGKPRESKGKRELYIGWTMDAGNKENEMGFSIFQFRPGYDGWALIVLTIYSLTVVF